MRVLVVDSYGRAGAALVRLLELHGHESRWVRDAAEALEVCDHEKFDLLIADLELSDGSGAELMRTLVKKCQVVGISMTADPGDDAPLKSHAAGFAAHFLKPLSFDELYGTIRRVMPAQ